MFDFTIILRMYLNKPEQESQYSLLSSQQSNEVLSLKKHKQPTQSTNWGEGQWNLEERLKYVAFLYYNKDSLHSKLQRRTSKIFKQMSHFISTRSPAQCRSQNQKMYRRFKTINKIVLTFKIEYGSDHFDTIFTSLAKDPNIRFILDGEAKSQITSSDSLQQKKTHVQVFTQTQGEVVVMSLEEMQRWKMYQYMTMLQTCSNSIQYGYGEPFYPLKQ